MKKKLLFIFLAAIIAISLIPMIVLLSSADITYIDISSYQDLVNHKSDYSNPNAVFRLTQDITMAGTDTRADFSATFDGQGHTIYNCTGAFLYLINSATFKNVTISDKEASDGAAFSATNSVFGSITESDTIGTVTVENVTVTRSVTTTTTSGAGIVFNRVSPNNTDGTVVIKDCSCTGTVTYNGTKGSANSSAGYVGAANNVKLSFTNCNANVTFDGSGKNANVDRALVGLGKASNGVTVNVSTQAQLATAAQNANANKDLCKKVQINLTSDLTRSGTWNAINFYGSFDGQGHTVYNLAGSFLYPMYSATFENFTVSNLKKENGSSINATGTTALFGSVGENDCPAGETVTIRNVRNERNVTVNKDDYNGAFFRNLAPAGSVTIENCTNSGNQNQGSGTGKLGGFVGTVNGGTITLAYCVNSGDIIGATAGGLIGDAGSSACKISLVGCRVENCTIGANAESGSAASLIGTCDPGDNVAYYLWASFCSAENVNVVAATARQLIAVASESERPSAYNCGTSDVTKNGSASWDGNANQYLTVVDPGVTPADNTLLRTVNFKADGYDPGFASDSNKGADVEISDDGTGVTFTVQNANNKRAMWGDYVVAPLPLTDGAKYTFIYDLTLGNDNVAFGLQVDGNNALVVNGAGGVCCYEWNSTSYGISAEESKNWINRTDISAVEKQTFAVTMDYDANTFALYVKKSNGSFVLVRSMTLNDCNWSGSRVMARFYVRQVPGTPDPDETYTAEVENLKIYKGVTAFELYAFETVSGAAVRMDTPTGLRFTGRVGKNLLSELKAEYGEENVKIGMLITPTDYLSANSLDFTKEALDGCGELPAGKKYVKIEATTILDGGAAYKINCVLSNVRAANYARKFSAVTYVEINGSTYLYADYSEEKNARSITFVAETALADLSDTQTGDYQYAVDGKYSPYTAAQRTTLAGFRTANRVTVMSYNIEMNDHGDDTRDPDKAVETILEYSADIVGLQEVDNEWDLSDLTAAGYARIDGTHAGTNWENIFYKTAKFNESGSGSVCFTTLPSSYPGVDAGGADMSGKVYTGFTWALLEEKTTGKTILAISTHLHYRKDKSEDFNSAENIAIRRYEIRLLCAWVAAQTFDAVAVVGDMNAHYLTGGGKDTINIFKNEGGFAVTRDSAAIKGDTNGTLANSGRTTRPEWIFDYILTKGNVDTVYYTVVDNRNDNGNTTYPSDHLPVLATLVVE